MFVGSKSFIHLLNKNVGVQLIDKFGPERAQYKLITDGTHHLNGCNGFASTFSKHLEESIE